MLGSPIAHSLSPVLHRAAYAEVGWSGTYEAIEVDEAGLGAFLDGCDDTWRGLSLTMPLKRTVVPLLDEVDDVAMLAGAANTVIFDRGRRVGHNTDVGGAVAALTERGVSSVRNAVILGGGATAASVGLAVAHLGASTVHLLARQGSRAEESAAVIAGHPGGPAVTVDALDTVVGFGGAGRLSGDLLTEPTVDLLVSTIPASAQDPRVVAVGRSVVASGGTVFEVIYHPWPTPLASAVLDDHHRISGLVSGLDLLVHQAVLQVELMTGTRPDPAVLRAAGEQALSARA